MSAEPLEPLLPTLEVIDATDEDAPTSPIAVALQEAVDLSKVVGQDGIRERLVAVGLHEEMLDALALAVGAAREAQARWVLLRDGGKTAAQARREAEGMDLRARIARACRWNLRERPVAIATLGAIMAGDGLPDLIQDLLDLAALVGAHPEEFEADTTFDAQEAIASARSMATAISDGLSASRADGAKRDAKLLRDRAYTHLDDQVSSIRAAGRYAFAGEPATVVRFRSRYQRRRRRRSAEAEVLDGEVGAMVSPEPAAEV
jgi:hypothetical protein